MYRTRQEKYLCDPQIIILSLAVALCSYIFIVVVIKSFTIYIDEITYIVSRCHNIKKCNRKYIQQAIKHKCTYDNCTILIGIFGILKMINNMNLPFRNTYLAYVEGIETHLMRHPYTLILDMANH